MKKLLATTAIILALGATSVLAEGGEDDFCPHKGGKFRDFMEHRQEALSKLPEEKAQLIRDTLKGLREGRREGRDEGKKLHDELRDILTAPEFDKTAFLAKSDEIHAFMGSMHQEHQKAIADLAAQLNAEERKVLAEVLPHPGMMKHHKGKRGRHHEEPEGHEDYED
ncbi:MAG: periplasmic heavy metal sensor [Hyphomicrobiales bacterium]|nr:periplasmic heavy metal sensor [Rickettsiales bacterium]MCP5362282.1 periplasmic heavy metal sensor [Hyphomicrobiales bacterium]